MSDIRTTMLTRWNRLRARIERGDIRPTPSQLDMCESAISALSSQDRSRVVLPPLSAPRLWPDPGPLPWPGGVQHHDDEASA
jgi:hypothetical protein